MSTLADRRSSPRRRQDRPRSRVNWPLIVALAFTLAIWTVTLAAAGWIIGVWE